jgi:phosphocarrier protein
MTTTQQRVTVAHESGLHARPASKFVQTASEFESRIDVGRPSEEKRADAKSSIAVISLGVDSGEEIEITAEGSDSDDAVERLVALVENDFDL